MERPLVSIVVPIYKVEAYLPRCLDSIAAQDYRPLEVILVNDGSPDNCGAIMEAYKAKWPELFVLIYQENQGLGPARNAGISRASGEWLCMVDSDDYIEPDYVSHLLGLAQAKGADIAVSSFYLEQMSGRKFSFPFMFQRCVTGEKAAEESLNMLTVPNFVWNKLYKTDLFKTHGIRFPRLYYEDMAVTVKVLLKAGKVAMSPKPLYHYVQRASSIVGNFSEKNVRDYLEVTAIVAAFLRDEGLYPAWKKSWRALMANSRRNLSVQIWFKLKHLKAAERRALLKETNRTLSRIDEELKKSAGAGS